MQIEQNAVVGALNTRDRIELERYGTTVPLTIDLILHESGDPVEYVYFPNDGLVCLQIKLSDLIREVGFVGSEGIVGANCDPIIRNSFVRSIVTVSGTAYRVPFDHFDRVLRQSSELQTLVARCNHRIGEIAQQLAACNLTHHLDARLCRWILQILRHSGGDHLVHGSQEHLSENLGVGRARLNEALQRLVHAGAIVQIRRGVFQVIETDYIQSHACECSLSPNFRGD